MTQAPTPETPRTTPPLSGKDAVIRALVGVGLREEAIVEKLQGGASTREFFRVRFGDRNAIAMFTPAPSQEIAKARQAGGYASFVEVQQLLTKRDIPVPQVLHACPETPVLIVEDLGDNTLANYLVENESRRTALYQTAVRTLAMAQNVLSTLPADSVVQTRAFDHDLLRWEVDHFLEWALDARGIVTTAQDREVFARCAEFLATEIASWPRVFVHRDYQSRNLMVLGQAPTETITWIDFQDAMMGPRVYDLVALLTDSYQTFSDQFIAERLREFAEVRNLDAELERIVHEFSVVTVQRKLKDAGRFIFLDRVNRNPSFLQYVEPTIIKARRALARVRTLGPLAELEDMLNRVLGPLG